MSENKNSNKYIAEMLRNVSAAYVLTDQNRFKVIAYDKAGDAVEHMTRELKDLWQEGKIKHIPGIGPSISAHLDEYFSTGESKHMNEVLRLIPSPVYQLMRIPGIGPKKAFKLVKNLSLSDDQTVVTDLLKAAEAGKIEGLESFGKKSQDDIIEAVKLYQNHDRREERMPLPYAAELAAQVIAHLQKLTYITRIDTLGSMRRSVSTIGDIDIAVTCPEEKIPEVIEHFLAYPNRIATDNAGAKKASIIVTSNIRVDLRVQEERTYGSMLQYFTGSKAHNVKLREYALRHGYSLSEYGIKPTGDEKPRHGKGFHWNKDTGMYEFSTEEDFYGFLSLPYIEPEIREGTNELDYAKKDTLPQLVTVSDMQGDLHTHSLYDLKPSHDMGAQTYEEMLKKAESLGYSYIGFSDHNPNLSNNTKQEIVSIMKKRKEHIDTIFSGKKSERTHYFIGLEVDIQPDGALALPEEAIEYVDYLIVSLHSSFRMSAKEMTRRVLRAFSYPKVRIFGHPSGRLLGKRPGVELEWNTIFAEAQDRNIAIEVNAWPERLDLADTLVREAVSMGVKCVIDTDAHAAEQMDNMRYGVSVARRGWATKNDIINTYSYQDFKKWIAG